MKHKIFSHTSLLIILSVILTFLAAGTVMYNRYDIYMKQGVRDEAAYIKTGLEEDGDVFLSDRVGDATSSRITLLGKDGQVLFDSIENPEEMENHSNRPEFIEAEKQGSGEMVRYSDTLSKQTFYYAVKLKDDQVLRVARTTDSLLVTMLTSFLLLGGLVCVILVIELFLVQKQTRKLIEPINRIDLEHPLEHVCYEELRPLLFRLDQQNRQIQKQLEVPVIIKEFNTKEKLEVDSKLLKMAEKMDAYVVTNDYNLNKVAEVRGVKVLNINELANAVKPMLLPGEEMTVTIIKAGKENGQGIAYLNDGTMIVVEGGSRRIGETLEVVVTSVLQTSAGRMIFTKIKSE